MFTEFIQLFVVLDHHEKIFVTPTKWQLIKKTIHIFFEDKDFEMKNL